MNKMKKRYIVLPLFMLFPLLAGCGEEAYSLDKFYVEHTNSYQLWDNFDYANLKVSYDGVELERNEYSLDLTNFNTSVVGSSSIGVTFLKDKEISKTIQIETKNRMTGNFLAIGGLESEDLVYYANEVIHSSAETLDLKIYAATVDNASLDDLYNYFVHDNALFTFHKYNLETNSWELEKEKTLKDILKNESIDWDILSVSEDALKASQASSYKNLNNFINSINSYLSGSDISKAVSFSWNMPWVYQDNVTINNAYYELYDNSQTEMYNSLVSNSKDIVASSTLFNSLLPSGTLIQNLRGISIVTDKDFTRDGVNLDTKYGRFAVALSLVYKLTGYQLTNFSFKGNTGLEISDEELVSIHSSIESAIKNPFEVAKP